MKQSELSGQLSGAESALAGSLREIFHAMGQHVMDSVVWVIFTVTVHTIRPAIRPHVLGVAMSVTET